MKVILTDVDGVLTDGRVTLDVHGNETKVVCYRDLDAIGIGRRAGYEFAFATGENTEMVDVLARRFGIVTVYRGAKDKLAALDRYCDEMGLRREQVVYIGDSDRDAPALEAAGLGIAPRDASPKALQAADITAQAIGGAGVLLEVVNGLIAGKLRLPVVLGDT